MLLVVVCCVFLTRRPTTASSHLKSRRVSRGDENGCAEQARKEQLAATDHHMNYLAEMHDVKCRFFSTHLL